MNNETPCTQHEEQINELARKTAELETRANYKDKRIDELNNKMDKIENKLDVLSDTVNKVMLNSIRDDNDLQQRVLALETKLDTQEELIQRYQQKAKEQRDEDRQKTNQKMTQIGLGLTALTIILAYIIPMILRHFS